MGALAAYSLPALVLFIVVVAVLEGLWHWFTGLGLVPWLRKRTGRSLTTAALNDFTRVFQAGKQVEIEERDAAAMRRDDEENGAPPNRSDKIPDKITDEMPDKSVGSPHRRVRGIDLDRGIVFLDPPGEGKP